MLCTIFYLIDIAVRFVTRFGQFTLQNATVYISLSLGKFLAKARVKRSFKIKKKKKKMQKTHAMLHNDLHVAFVVNDICGCVMQSISHGFTKGKSNLHLVLQNLLLNHCLI